MHTTTSELEAFLAAHRPLNEDATWEAGAVLDGWRVTAFLGRGGGGEVYRVEQVETGRAAALKVLCPKSDASEASRATAQSRFLREADFLLHNDTPFFPKAFAVGEANGSPYVVMELLEARPLPRGDRAVAAFLLAVCRAVRVLHRRGFVHRDIKPANILWRANGELVLSDLGLLKQTMPTAGHTGVTATLVNGRAVGAGTPHYAAPEQFDGGGISVATDIHALGVLIDDCFGGNPPSDWARIVRRATSSLPGRRYSDVENLMRAVRGRHMGRVFLWCGLALLVGGTIWWACRPQLPRDPQALRRMLAAAEVEAEAARQQAIREREAAHWQGLCETVVTNVKKWTCSPWKRTVDRNGELITIRTHIATNREAAFTLVRLGGGVQTFTRPIVVSPERELWIVGPGTLDATLTGSDTGRCTRVRLDNCVLLNRTRLGPVENALHYDFCPGAYLNFIDQSEEDGRRWREEVLRLSDEFDGERNDLAFGGPATRQERRTHLRKAEIDSRLRQMDAQRNAINAGAR